MAKLREEKRLDQWKCINVQSSSSKLFWRGCLLGLANVKWGGGTSCRCLSSSSSSFMYLLIYYCYFLKTEGQHNQRQMNKINKENAPTTKGGRFPQV